MNKRGGDPDIGRKLPRMFLAAGVSEVGLHAVQPMSLVGEAKHINPVTLSAIGPAVLADGLATEDELAQIESELEEFANDPATLVAAPRVFQVWGTSHNRVEGGFRQIRLLRSLPVSPHS